MSTNTLLCFAAAFCAVAVAGYGLYRSPRALAHRTFALGMGLLALEAVFAGLSIAALLPEDALYWQKWRFAATAFLPGLWFAFTVIFPREDEKAGLGRWRCAIIAALLGPLLLVTIFASNLFQGLPSPEEKGEWALRLAWSGVAFLILVVLSAVLILTLLERTLRDSRGRQRWQVKFLVLGIASIFAARLYTDSQALLFHSLYLRLEAINAVALVAASGLMLVALLRARSFQLGIYPSQRVLYGSLTLLVVGVYFIAVAFLAKVAQYLDASVSLPIGALCIFLALVALSVFLFSDRLRQKARSLVTRHLRRPFYDYRNAWMAFTQRTATLVAVNELCSEVAKMVAEMVEALSVSIWLLDQTTEGLRLGGSTVFSETQARGLPGIRDAGSHLVRFTREHQGIVEFGNLEGPPGLEPCACHAQFIEEARIGICAELVAGGDLLGFLTLDERVGYRPFSDEELDLVRTIAAQVAGTLLHLKLADRLRETRELETFQTVAALFVHDLKNLASNLSMMLQNLPAHFDNPAFREDALRSLSNSVSKINTMGSRLNVLREKLDVKPVEADLNEVVKHTVIGLRGMSSAPIMCELRAMPKMLFDPEQIQKVVTNLVLNAQDAVSNGGEISVTTERRDGWVELTVSDTGCGMSPEVMEKYLFRPFKTTKKQGMGIGLFHSKLIVEAHRGRMEVESKEGVGSTFRVILPAKAT
jgi:putative PEP-CTERM system histidine kinase